MSEVKRTVVFTDLASILDLRQGYMTTVADTFGNLSEYLCSDEYLERDMDSFPFGTEDGYRKMYVEGDLRLLEGSIVTYVLSVVSGKLSDSEIRDKFNGETTLPELWVNTYPFKLTREQNEQLRNLIFYRTGCNNFIEMMYLTPNEVSPAYMVENNFISAFIYDFSDWFDCHSKYLAANPNPDIPIYFAPILKVAPSKEELKAIDESGFRDIFNLTEFNLSLVARISFLPICFYASHLVAKRYVDKYNKEFGDEIQRRAEEIEVPEEYLYEHRRKET